LSPGFAAVFLGSRSPPEKRLAPRILSPKQLPPRNLSFFSGSTRHLLRVTFLFDCFVFPGAIPFFKHYGHKPLRHRNFPFHPPRTDGSFLWLDGLLFFSLFRPRRKPPPNSKKTFWWNGFYLTACYQVAFPLDPFGLRTTPFLKIVSPPFSF